MAKKMNPKNKPWVPFYTAAWLGSSTVVNMSMGERGIYITLMALCWQYGDIPWEKKTLAKLLGIDPRTVGAFMEKYDSLTEECGDSPENSGDFPSFSRKRVLPKLQEFAETLAKNVSAESTEEKRVEKKRGDESKAPLVSVASVMKTDTPSPSKLSVTAGFDPLTYSKPVVSSKGEKLEYPPADVHRILVYHLKHRPSEFWIERVTSSNALPRYIDTMFEQMVRDVGNDWTPPQEKKPLTRMAGDPACIKCRGLGTVGKLLADNLTRVSVECEACEKHQQIASGKEWVDL